MIKIPKTPWENFTDEAIADLLPLANQLQFYRMIRYCKETAHRYAYLVSHPQYLSESGSKDYRLKDPVKPSRKGQKKRRGVKK